MPDDLKIRPYGEADEPQVVSLWQAVFSSDPPWNVPADDIRRKLNVQRSLFLVGECNSQVVGTVMAGFEGRRGWINRLAVLPEFRRQGIARSLMAEAEKRLLEIGAPKINLQVRAANRKVVVFYESIGYAVEDLVSMGRRINEQPSHAQQTQDDAHRILVNDDVYLSEIRSPDTAALIEHLNDRDIYERTLRIPYPYTETDAEAFLNFVSSETQSHGHPLQWAIRGRDDRLIGCLGFERLSYGHRAEIGYWLARPYWGRGIMTDVVGAACAFAIENWHLARITAHVFDFNRSSARVLEKNDFQLEGKLNKVHKKDGRFIDSLLYARVD